MSRPSKPIERCFDSFKDLLDICKSADLEALNEALKNPELDPSYNCNYAFVTAVMWGHLEIVKRLHQDPRVDPSANSNMALNIALESNDIEMVKELLWDRRVSEHPLEILLTACRFSSVETMRYLVTHFHRPTAVELVDLKQLAYEEMYEYVKSLGT